MLTLNDGRSELWQWDTGRTLTVDADCSQVHFSNKVFGRSIDVDVIDGVAIIPDILLQTDKDLDVWAFVGTAENGYTKISKIFKVNRRNKPADYVFTPFDQMTIDEIAAIAQSVRDDADAGLFNGEPGDNGITPHIGYNGNWYIGDTDTRKPSRGETGPAGPKGDTGDTGGWYTPAVTQPDANTMRFAFTPSKEGMPEVPPKDIAIPGGSGIGGSGEDGGYYSPSVDADGNLSWTASKTGMPAVDGANIKGPQGISGVYVGSGDMPDGYNVQIDPDGTPSDIIPHIGVNGNWYIGDTDTGKPSRGEIGPAGQKGEAGENGADGHTPVKGTDYFTESDKIELVNAVLAALPNAEGVSF